MVSEGWTTQCNLGRREEEAEEGLSSLGLVPHLSMSGWEGGDSVPLPGRSSGRRRRWENNWDLGHLARSAKEEGKEKAVALQKTSLACKDK